MNPLRRIQKEINDIQVDKESSIGVDVIDGELQQSFMEDLAAHSLYIPGNIRHLIGTFPGPEGSPYQGGLFKVVSPISQYHYRAASQIFEPLRILTS